MSANTIRRLAAAAAITFLATGAAAAAETLQSCELGVRNPAAPKELDQYAFLIGNWKITARSMDPQTRDWSPQTREAYWEGRWILDGRAIADYWYDTPPNAPGPPPGRGVNVRMFRPETKQWTNMWQHSGLAEVRTLTSEVRDDGLMHMWATQPDTSKERRMRFVVESADSWYRLEEWSRDEGKSWFPVSRLEATRVACTS